MYGSMRMPGVEVSNCQLKPDLDIEAVQEGKEYLQREKLQEGI